MSLPSIFNAMGSILEEVQMTEILRTNEASEKYGLILTAQEAKEIMELRNHVLQSYGRVELDIEVTGKLIQSFCTSSFIDQEEYASTLKDLQEIFYYMKNETEDQIGDDELIETMKDYFEKDCGGSIELLKGRELEAFARSIRCRNQEMDYLLEEEEQRWD